MRTWVITPTTLDCHLVQFVDRIDSNQWLSIFLDSCHTECLCSIMPPRMHGYYSLILLNSKGSPGKQSRPLNQTATFFSKQTFHKPAVKLPVAPVDLCCMNGCRDCVWDVYATEVQQVVDELREKTTKENEQEMQIVIEDALERIDPSIRPLIK